MIEQLRLIIVLIGALFDTMPQVDTTTNTKIPDAEYYGLIADGVIGMVKGAGFSFGLDGLSESQLRGAIIGFCPVVVRYKAAPRVAV